MSLSEVEDDPEPFESSEDEWTETERRVTRTRCSKRVVKRLKKTVVEENDSSDSETENNISKKGMNKKSKKTTPKSANKANKKQGSKVVPSNNFSVGSFVISKKDAKVGDPNKHPWIWRIDGKSLLQKYEAIEHEGKIRHKNTSVYTGWSPLEIDNYAPITVDLIEQGGGKIIVEIHWKELEWIVREDSD